MKIRTALLTATAIFVGLRSYSQINPTPPGTLQQSLQPKVKYDVFSRPSLGQIPIALPHPAQFESVSSTYSPGMNQPLQINSLLISQNLIGRQNQQIIQQNNLLYEHDNFRRNDQSAEIQRDLMEEKLYKEHIEWLDKSKYYRSAYSQLMQLKPDSFSITKAVYIVENAWLENKYSFEIFRERLQVEAKVIKQQLKSEKLSLQDNLALNYGIQKRYRQNIYQYDLKSKQTRTVKPFGYDFEDFQGQKNYDKMFTTKMMVTGKGQCHSMPLMYLMIAEQLGAKAWLSLAPQHSFVRFSDKNGSLLNFETTNGNLVSTNWLLQSGFINANALKSKTYLDTLSQKQLFAQCLSDLLVGYLSKFNYDGFAEQLMKTISSIDQNNMTALILDANIKTQIAMQSINAAGETERRRFAKISEAYRAYLDMMAAYEKVDRRGYQDMPKEAYAAWLKTIEQERKKQETKELRSRCNATFNFLKSQDQSS
ncbi:MAG: hypothetical protein WDO16_01465 [Bacteroidota bacterium]